MASSAKAQREALLTARRRESVMREAMRAASIQARNIRTEIIRDLIDYRDPAGRVRTIVEPMRKTLSALMTANHLSARATSLRRRKRIGLDFDRTEFGGLYEIITGLARRLRARPSEVDAITAGYDDAARKTLQNLAASIQSKVGQVANDVLARGITTQAAVPMIRDALDAMGLGATDPRLIETVYRTQGALAYGAGRWNANQDPDVREVLWGYEYTTVGDDRVRPNHALMDGFRARADSTLWDTRYPPCGWNCRCDVLEIYEGDPMASEVAPQTGGHADPGWGFNAGKVYRDSIRPRVG